MKHVPDFEVLPWKVPKKMLDWKREYIDNPFTGRPRALVIIGPPHSGKTEWACSFGTPSQMTKQWCFASMVGEFTHLVVNDVDVRYFFYTREILGCQASFVMQDKWVTPRLQKFNKPVVFTVNPDLDPTRVKWVKAYLEGCGAVIVRIQKKLYL